MSSNTPESHDPSTYAPPAPYVEPVSYSRPRANRTNGLAIAALITAIFIGLVGVILGHIALNQLKTSGEDGRGLAIGALAVGYASMALGLVFVVMTFSVAASYR